MCCPRLFYEECRETGRCPETWKNDQNKSAESELYWERLQDLGRFSLDKRRFNGDMVVAFKYLKDGYRDSGGTLFSLVMEQDVWQWVEIPAEQM